ncbi:PulJ/GspJ family protein [Deinococcus hohokamensis]|uniref:Type II secretion system protein J n=1 Tax=Deinococcus hohokamensis TaxID=309883 RepID=A0ABV9I9I8_9DEIO
MRRHGAQGLTLVELLVAMAIMGVIFTLITHWQVSTLQLSARSNALSRSLGDLNDLSGYLGDRVRAAVRVRVATSGLSVNSGAGSACSTDRPCLAVVLPEYSPSSVVDRYNLYVYRMMPRSAVTHPDDKVEDPWADSHVQVLKEYRSEDHVSTPINCVLGAGETFDSAAAPACVTMRNLDSATSFGGLGSYLVADHLTPAGSLGAGHAPFAYDRATRVLTLEFQHRQQVRGQTTLLPAAEPYSLQVQARNVP